MEIPSEFKSLVRSLNQSAIPNPFNEDEWIGRAIKSLSGNKKMIIRKYLDDLLAQKPSGKELQRIWQSGAPDYILGDDDLRVLLDMITRKL